MKTSHKVGLATLLLLTLGSAAACSSDENGGPSENTGGTVISGSGGKGTQNGTGGGNEGGSGGGNLGGDTGSGGQDGTGGFIEPENPDCNEDDDYNETDGCWDIHDRPCNGQENIHFLNQCTDGGFCGDDAFDNGRIQGWSGGTLPTPT